MLLGIRYSTAALFLFGLSILLPQGVGFRLPWGLPNFDLPRLAILALLGFFVLRTLHSGRIALNGASRTLTLFFLLSVWGFVSAYASESPSQSLIWAIGSALVYWGFAFAFISLADPRRQRGRIIRSLVVIVVILSVWSVIELITQQKLVPVRNIWEESDYMRFSTTLRRLIPGSSVILPYMSIGPYALNLSLAGALCALGGFLLLGRYRSGTTRLLTYGLFILAVLATQSRAGIVALGVMILVMVAWRKSGRARFWLLSAAVLVVALAWVVGGQQAQLLVTSSLEGATATAEENTGSVAARLLGLSILLGQIDRWWLLGFGPGSLFDADRVTSSVEGFSDAGLFFAFFIESGLPAGLFFSILILGSIWRGIRSLDPDVRAATLGLIGFLVTALSSVTPWALGIALVLAGLIESWSKGDGRVDTVSRAIATSATPYLSNGSA